MIAEIRAWLAERIAPWPRVRSCAFSVGTRQVNVLAYRDVVQVLEVRR